MNKTEQDLLTSLADATEVCMIAVMASYVVLLALPMAESEKRAGEDGLRLMAERLTNLQAKATAYKSYRGAVDAMLGRLPKR